MGRREPAVLSEILDAVASLRDSKGSPPDKILDRIISKRKTPLKNASLLVKKALKTGLKTGLLKEIGGKFKLGLGTKDYAIFKNFRQLEKSTKLPIREVRRRRRRRRRSRSGRRRRSRRKRLGKKRSDNLEDSPPMVTATDSFSLVKLAKSSTLPVREVRRKRRRRSRRSRSRRRKRRGRGRKRSQFLQMDELEGDNDSSAEPLDRGRRRRRKRRSRRRGRGRRGRRRALEDRVSLASSESKEVSGKSSEEKPKSAKTGDERNPPEKRDIVPEPPRNRLDNESASDHCIHSFLHEGGHYVNPPDQNHYGGEYYE